jgi:hypothetical protein
MTSAPLRLPFKLLTGMSWEQTAGPYWASANQAIRIGQPPLRPALARVSSGLHPWKPESLTIAAFGLSWLASAGRVLDSRCGSPLRGTRWAITFGELPQRMGTSDWSLTGHQPNSR